MAERTRRGDLSFPTPPLKPFPLLAVELVRTIFDAAAETDKKTSLALALASKNVHKWIVPIIYHTVILNGSATLCAFRDTLQTSATSLGASVRSLWIGLINGLHYLNWVAEIIDGCTQLERLAVREIDMSGPEFYETLDSSAPEPRHVVLIESALPPPPHSLLRNVTHPYIDNVYAVDPDEVLALRSVTHFGFGCWGESATDEELSFVSRVLSSPNVVILLLQVFSMNGLPSEVMIGGTLWSSLAKVEDERLIAWPGPLEEDYIYLVKSEDTIWDDAKHRYKDWRALVKDRYD